MAKVLVFLLMISSLSMHASAAARSGDLIVQQSFEGSAVTLTVSNTSGVQSKVWERVVLAGKGGGNLLFFAVNERGQAALPCGFFDSPAGPGRATSLGPGQSRKLWDGSLKTLSKMHCLEKGRYSGFFGYVVPGGRLVTTTPFKFFAE